MQMFSQFVLLIPCTWIFIFMDMFNVGQKYLAAQHADTDSDSLPYLFVLIIYHSTSRSWHFIFTSIDHHYSDITPLLHHLIGWCSLFNIFISLHSNVPSYLLSCHHSTLTSLNIHYYARNLVGLLRNLQWCVTNTWLTILEDIMS